MFVMMGVVLLACQPDKGNGSMFATTDGTQSDFGYSSSSAMDSAADTGTMMDAPDEDSNTEQCGIDDATADADPMTLTGRPECGELFYADACGICHGANGEGGNGGPQLNGHLDGMDTEMLHQIIQNGPGNMPSYSDIHPQLRADVVVWMQENF